MDDCNNYAVIGLLHYDALRDELAVLRYENQRLQRALDAAVEKHREIQERLGCDSVEEWLQMYEIHTSASPSSVENSTEKPDKKES